MKKLILKLLGFQSVTDLKLQIEDIKKTVSSLTDEATHAHKQIDQVFKIYEALNIDKEKEYWWQNVRRSHENREIWILAEQIKKDAQIEWASKHPALKVKKVFHGGCLSCITPLEDGIGKCLGCRYMSADWGLPSLKRESKTDTI